MGYPVTNPPVVMRPILPMNSVNQSAPSGPATIPKGWLFCGVGTGYSAVTTPAVVMRPILLLEYSVNQSAPSDPVAIPAQPAAAVGTGYSVTTPAVEMRPILLAVYSVNQSA